MNNKTPTTNKSAVCGVGRENNMPMVRGSRMTTSDRVMKEAPLDHSCRCFFVKNIHETKEKSSCLNRKYTAQQATYVPNKV